MDESNIEPEVTATGGTEPIEVSSPDEEITLPEESADKPNLSTDQFDEEVLITPNE